MKRYLHLLLAGVFIMMGTVSAMGQKQVRAKLQGIWQMCFYVSGSPDVTGDLKPSNSFKILTNDGRFTNMTVIPNHGAIIIGQGTYKVNSDSEYVEHVEKSLDLPQLSGSDNILSFTLKEENSIMVLKYFVEKDANGNQIDAWCYETWKKVVMPPTYPKDLVR